ncbi:MAG: MFS transporter [Rhodospirillaceae bacterium]|nr:MFS transporter [Rhodospirillaceae bacterium]
MLIEMEEGEMNVAENRRADGTSRWTRNVTLLNGLTATRNLLFILPVFTLHFADTVGLAFSDVIASQAAFAATMVVCEVPSGWLSDRWRRVAVLRIGSVLWLAAAPLFWLASDLATLVLAEVVMAVAASLVSGTDSAFLHDSLEAEGQTHRFLAEESRRHGIAMASVGISTGIGGALYALAPNLVFLFQAIAFAVAAGCSVLLVEPPKHFKEAERRHPRALLRVLHAEFRTKPDLVRVIIFAGFLSAATLAGNWLQQAYLVALTVPPTLLGPIVAAGFLIGAGVTQTAPALEARYGWRALLGFLVLGMTVVCVTVGLLDGPAGIPLAGVPLTVATAIVWGLSGPVLRDLVNQRANPSHRATMMSVLGLAPRLVFVPLGFCLGFVVDVSDAATAYVWLGAFVLLAGGGTWFALAQRDPD